MGTEVDLRVQQISSHAQESFNKAMRDHAMMIADSEALRLRNIALTEGIEQREVTIKQQETTIRQLNAELHNLRLSEQRLLVRYTELLTSMNNAVTVITSAVDNSKGDFSDNRSPSE